MDKKKRSKNDNKRHGFQFLWSFLTNSYILGFFQGKIYQGKLKNLCVPGLNCYSCPGALGSCPIGALQSMLASGKSKLTFYVLGFLFFVGGIFGRYVCGWLCPFGLIQELLNKIPFPKKLRTFKLDGLLRKLKYVILLVFVILLPMTIADIAGVGDPWFCKYICPAGTLEGGLPLILTNDFLRESLGWLYVWKNVILVITVILSVIIYRPFCKYICPLGAIYSLFNKVSVFKMRIDKDKCNGCGKCAAECEMNIDPIKNVNSAECIRCRKCINSCPTGALTDTFSAVKSKNVKTPKESNLG